jgi:hypothetical protein
MSTTTTPRKVYNMFERRQAIPVLYVRGTHYDCGYDVVSIESERFFHEKMREKCCTIALIAVWF